MNVVKHMFIIGSGTAAGMLVSLVTTPVVTRLTSTGDYGLYSLCSTYANLLLMLLLLGFDQAFIRFYYSEKDNRVYQRSLLLFCVGVSLLAWLLVATIITVLSFVSGGADWFSAALLLYVLILILNRFALLQLRVQYLSKRLAYLGVLQKIAFLVFVVGAAFVLNYSVDAFVLIGALFVSYLLPTLVAIWSQRSQWSIFRGTKFSMLNYKNIAKYGLPFVFSTSVTAVFQSIDKLGISYFCTISDLGIFAGAMTLVNIFALIQVSFNTVWAPLSIEHYEKDKEDKLFYQQWNQRVIVVMLIVGATIIAFKDVIVLFLGEEFREAAVFIPFLCFIPIMYTISETSSCGINLMQKTKYNIFISVVVCIFNILGCCVLIPILGAVGAAISTGVSYIAFWALRTFFSSRLFKMDYGLRKFLPVLSVMIIFSIHETFFSFSWVSVVLYGFLLLLVTVIYRECLKLMAKKMIDIYKRRKSE